jgi:hypothetical protein
MPEAGAHSPYTEKRKHNRFAMEAALHYFDPSGNAAVNGRLRDISACGMGFISPHPLIPGEHLELFLYMPDSEEKLYKKFRVCWSSPTDTGKYRIGVQLDPPEINPIPLVLRSIVAKRKY